ncbi:MAG: GTPase Ryh1 [Marteilia pararefringens]
MTVVKLVVVGMYNTGKTSLIKRYTKDTFESNCRSTIGIELVTKSESIEGQTVDIQLWDTAGAEKFQSMVPVYYKKAHGAIIVFDAFKRKSFEEVDKLYKNINEGASNKNLPILIVANKIDRQAERQVSEEEGLEKAKQLGAPYIETSAKTGHNCRDMFIKLVTLCIEANLSQDSQMQTAGQGNDGPIGVPSRRRRSTRRRPNEIDLGEGGETKSCLCFS